MTEPVTISAPPPNTGELFPRPYDRNTPLRERVTGYVFRSNLSPYGSTMSTYYLLEAGSPAPAVIRYLPAPPAGEQWLPHPWAYTGGYRFHILSGDDAEPFMPLRESGCSVNDIGEDGAPAACPEFCIWRDGCPACNPEEWKWCPSGNCGQEGTLAARISEWEFPGDDCDCYHTCEECGERFSTIESPAVENEGTIHVCHRCLYRLFTYHDNCDWWYRDNNGHDCDAPCDCGDCDDCGSATNGDLINYYSYKPYPVFHGDGPVYLGVEMEIDTESGSKVRPVAEYVSSQVGDVAYMKDDSSIGDGFELVTHPMSYRWAMANFPWGMFAEMRNRWGLRNGYSCGIHVHVNRDGFTDQRHAYRWLKFIYRNQDALTALSRRRNGTLDEWGGFRPDSRAWAIHHAKTGANASHSDSWSDYYGTPHPRAWWATEDKRNRHGLPHYAARYSAVNVQNDHTFELRFFAGSVYASQVQAAIGFANASVEYTRTLTARNILTGNGWEWSTFVDYLRNPPGPDDMYAPLLSEIERLVKP